MSLTGRARRRISGILAFLVLLCPAAAWSFDLTGRIDLTGSSSERRLADAMEGTIVYFVPDEATRSPQDPKTVVMTTRQKTFQPRVVAVNPGSTVRFPNEDTILHNVFSVSPGNSFDLGFYRRGDGKAWTFEKPGLVRVFCNVHYSMAAHVLVLETPHFVRPEADGTFRLQGLPRGAGELRVWNDRARPFSVDMVLPAPGPVEVSLSRSRKRVVPHLNKHGEPYKRGGRDEDYR